MPTLFSKEHVIFGSHPDNLVADKTYLTHQKSDPSEPDRLGHLTQFQPCLHDNVHVNLGKSRYVRRFDH